MPTLQAAEAKAVSTRSRGERLAFWEVASSPLFSASSDDFAKRKKINCVIRKQTILVLHRALLSLSRSSPAAMSPRALSTTPPATAGTFSARAAAPIARGAARVPADPLRRRSVLVRAEESKSELSGAEKVINSITSFLNNSPLAQGTSVFMSWKSVDGERERAVWAGERASIQPLF